MTKQNQRKILGIDVGVKNLGVCVLQDAHIEFCECFTIVQKKRPNVEDLGFSLYTILDTIMDTYNPMIIGIENQPAKLQNKTVKTVQMLIESFFIALKYKHDSTVPKVKRVNPASKLKGLGLKKGGYKNNKQNAIQCVNNLFSEEYLTIEDDSKQKFESLSKKDDISDAILIAMCNQSRCS